MADDAVHGRGDAEAVIEQRIPPREQDLGGFSVRRLLPYRGRRMVGPWIFFDHMGPVDLSPGSGIDVRPHPHINLATVTYLFDGEIRHRDSLGSDQLIRPGAINLMIAGSGIVHSERETAEARARQRRVHGLQLWLALPEPLEETAPDFEHYAADAIPATDVDGVPVRVMMGAAYGLVSPVRTFAKTLYVEARPAAGQRLRLPDDADQRALYVAVGAIDIRGERFGDGAMVTLRSGTDVELTAVEDSLLAVIGGEALSPRHIWWNFVSSRKERIEQAKQDWAAQRFDRVPGDEQEYIPLPES